MRQKYFDLYTKFCREVFAYMHICSFLVVYMHICSFLVVNFYLVVPQNASFLLSFGKGHSIYCCWTTFHFGEGVITFAGQSDFQSYADALWWGVVSFLDGENQANVFFVHIPDGESQANIFSFSLLNVVVLFPQYFSFRSR